MLSDRRKPFATGQSKGITLPAAMQINDKGVSMAASDRLIIMDTTGEVPEDKLLQFYMQYVEPAFHNWWQSQKQATTKRGGIRVMQEDNPLVVSAAKPIEAEGVATPQPDVPLVSCFRCGELIAWTIDPRATAICPRCRAILRLVAIPKP